MAEILFLFALGTWTAIGSYLGGKKTRKSQFEAGLKTVIGWQFFWPVMLWKEKQWK